MRVGDSWRKLASSDLAALVLLATAGVLLHTITNGQYGFHHDELATLDDARSLAWGYVAYPPLTPTSAARVKAGWISILPALSTISDESASHLNTCRLGTTCS
jgi:hypothetical protein